MFLRIAECARARPTDLALAFPDRGREYSWSELLASLQAESRLLAATGIRPGDAVGICTPSPEDQTLSFFSLMMLGAIPTIAVHPDRAGRKGRASRAR